MGSSSSFSYPEYLRSKESVDARALNERVWGEFVRQLDASRAPLRVLEVGGGIGAMVKWMVGGLEGTGTTTSLRYTLVDIEPKNIERAEHELDRWARERGYTVTNRGEEGLHFHDDVDVSVRLIPTDLHDLSPDDHDAYDAIVAQAVLDLVDVPHALKALRPLLREGGLWYLPLHFDGVTAFEPTIEPALDDQIEQLYHRSMQTEDVGSSGARTGRHLFGELRSMGASIVEAGSSDWIVFAGPDGYPDREAEFLRYILQFVESELSDHPELESEAFAQWLRTRHHQIDMGTLVYVAHQIDLLARNDPASTKR